ncbi:sensor histidine kinase [Saliterribacillus persicus]|uniref:histidine kinase n=1 Tax=Saliterribacillus persicus TaxID=930114 RepID=A0A368YAJ5_9BACI|nr:histidine kinase [Saliterribacillus persicus]RCW77280.1 two-component system sensor histidine kinase YesM [Saliterribacillus persicus]
MQLINKFKKMSLKGRIAIVFAVSTFIPLLFTVVFSYFTMSSILTNKLNTTFNSNLNQIRLTLENTIDDMNYVSQQIDFSENINITLENYLKLEPSLEKTQLYDEIKNELNVITFSNPNIGLSLLYIEEDDSYVFNSHWAKDDFTLRNDPLFIKGYKIDNFGPHVSMERFNNKSVLSTVRELDINYSQNVYLYIESNLDLTKNILESDNVINETSYLILDENKKIIYSEQEKAFSINQTFNPQSNKNYGTTDGYYWFREDTERGWSIVSLISVSQYNEEINQWIIMMIYIAILFVVISLVVGLLLWKTFYKPLNQFNREVKLMGDSNFHSEIVQTSIPEFIDLTHRFRYMRKQISTLITEIEQKERNRADLEVEKLLHQINPHFLMNTLDTARWLAVSGEKDQVIHLISSLNKILYYNMGKLGQSSTLKDELDSMEQYLQLQQIRYDFTYNINIYLDDRLLNTYVPRFILQPIVENSIYHGLVDDGQIDVNIQLHNHEIMIEVKDDGRGMSREKINRILYTDQLEEKKQGMGIGLNYVKRILEKTYHKKARIEIVSTINKGTSVILYIPNGGEKSDSSIISRGR